MVSDEEPKEKVLNIYECEADCQYHGRTLFLVDFTKDGKEIICAKCVEEFAKQLDDKKNKH